MSLNVAQLFANDYDIRRLYLGPFMDRDPEILEHISGLVLNPNNELHANFCPIHTFGSWYQAAVEKKTYVASDALKVAIDAWLPSFKTTSEKGMDLIYPSTLFSLTKI